MSRYVPTYRFGPYDPVEFPYGIPADATEGLIVVDKKRRSLCAYKAGRTWFTMDRQWVGPSDRDVILIWKHSSKARAVTHAKKLLDGDLQTVLTS